MEPKQLIVVDIYENSAYDLQQGLFFVYKGRVDIRVEIVSITNTPTRKVWGGCLRSIIPISASMLRRTNMYH